MSGLNFCLTGAILTIEKRSVAKGKPLERVGHKAKGPNRSYYTKGSQLPTKQRKFVPILDDHCGIKNRPFYFR